MAKARVGVALAVGCLLLGGTAPAWAAPTVAQMLAYHPKQEGVAISTPAPSEYAACKVELVTSSRPGSSGWLLKDPSGRPLRRFFDSNGDKRIDVWSYYKDGAEVYREVDSNLDGTADQYRWLHAGGMKWGVDANQDGKIDAWKMISAAEAAQEAFAALAAQDFARLQALFLNEAEIRALGLPAAEADRLRKKIQDSSARFQEAARKLQGLGPAQLVQVEAAVPQCVPADVAGTERDLFKHPTRSVLFEYGGGEKKQQEWMQTGEMIQVGMAWRLCEAPYLGSVVPGTGGVDPITPAGDEVTQKLMEKLADLDKQTPTMPETTRPDPAIVRHYLQRADLVQQIGLRVGKGDLANAADWTKQMADNLSTAAQYAAAGETAGLRKLQQLKDLVARGAPGTNLAGYVTFQVLWTEYNPKLSSGNPRDQAEWLEKLAGFVQSYPKADNTADALMYLGMGCEFAGKDEEAKRWYKQLATSFPDNPSARKAEGCVRRLDLVGKDLGLAGQTTAGAAFDLTSLKGKVVAVYYWASYSKTCDEDFTRLKQLQDKLGAKGFALVTVDLDDRPADGAAALQRAGLPGTHLAQPAVEGGGLNGPLATQYGILGVPTLFVVGKDGKVLSRNMQVNGLEEAVQKAL